MAFCARNAGAVKKAFTIFTYDTAEEELDAMAKASEASAKQSDYSTYCSRRYKRIACNEE